MMPNKIVPCLRESDLKEGQMKHVHVHGLPVLLIKKGGQVFAVWNICPHMGCSLEKGILREYLVMCPCHGWKFDIRNGLYEDNKATSLITYPVKTLNGKIWIEISDKTK